MGTKAKKKPVKKRGNPAAKKPETTGCHACNFTGEICQTCGEPINSCDCGESGFIAKPCKCQQPEPDAGEPAAEQPEQPEQQPEQPPEPDAGEPAPPKPAAAKDSDPELETLVEESVKRRIERFNSGTRRRHHTKQLSFRVLHGIIAAGKAAAQGGADGFFGQWTRTNLAAWEGLMDAAEWAQEEINRREYLRLKREAAKSTADKTQDNKTQDNGGEAS